MDLEACAPSERVCGMFSGCGWGGQCLLGFLWEPWLSGHFQVGSILTVLRASAQIAVRCNIGFPKFSTNSVLSQETISFPLQTRTFKQRMVNIFFLNPHLRIYFFSVFSFFWRRGGRYRGETLISCLPYVP